MLVPARGQVLDPRETGVIGRVKEVKNEVAVNLILREDRLKFTFG